MERFAQYLDSLEDLFYAFALKAERLKQILAFSAFIVLSIALQAACIAVALYAPPAAGAVAALLIVSVLYRSAVSGARGISATT